MPIDDPVGITIRQAQEDTNNEAYLPTRLVKLGISAFLAHQLQKYPAVMQILNTLLSNSSARFERRFLIVAEELNAHQQRIEEKIPDKSYYESEEFQSLLGIVIEKLHTTHDEEKLRIFGDALANSGSKEFEIIPVTYPEQRE